MRGIMKVRTGLVVLTTFLVTGCSSFNMPSQLARLNTNAEIVGSNKVELILSEEHRKRLDARADALLAKPLSMNDAVEVMLAKSPAFQKILFDHWREAALSAQSGRIANPTFSFERMVTGPETEYGRLLTFGLIDVMTLPVRQASASLAIEQTEIRLSAEVFAAINQTRMAWVNAVAAQEKLFIAQKVANGTSATAELAKRMKKTGNFSTTERLRQHLIFSQASIALAEAQHQSVQAREQLTRILGLNFGEAQKMILPTALPDLPDDPLTGDTIARGIERRFDVQIARLSYQTLLKRAGVERVNSYTDIEYGRRYDTIKESDSVSHKKGFELDIKVPIFDWGDMRRDALRADLMARQQAYKNITLSAASQMRESYSRYRTSFDIAHHYQDQILPMQETLLEEATYQYNGMIIGVFEYAQAGKEMADIQQAAIDAKRNYMISEISMKSIIMGRPIEASLTAPSAKQATPRAGH